MLFTKEKHTILFFLFVLTTLLKPDPLQSQEMPGMRQGNFAGSQSVWINPANMFQSKVFFDVQLGALSGFAQNNFAYIPANDFRSYQILNEDVNLPVYEPSNNNFLYRTDERTRFGTVNIHLGGPSALFINGDHAFALNTAVRSYASTNALPFEVPIFGVEGLSYPPLYNIRFTNTNLQMGSMMWGEVGISYAYSFYKAYRDHWAAGITVKGLMAYGGGFLNLAHADYVVLNDSTMNILNVEGTAGMALPIDYDNNDFPASGSFFKGGGIGFDFGITFTRTQLGIQRHNPVRVCEQPFNDYEFRLGISLIDLGYVNFTNDAQLHYYEGSHFWESVDTMGFTNINNLTRDLSRVFYDDEEASYTDNRFRMGLPTALSIQFDYNFMPDWYVNATLIQPIRLLENTITRPAQLTLTPRYETDWFEFGVPIGLYEYRMPRIGVFARIGYFTIGTDRLGTLFGISDMDGMDIYASLKFNLRRGICIGGRDSGACARDDLYKKAMKRGFLWW